MSSTVRMQVRMKEKEAEEAEIARERRLRELWKEAWLAVGSVPPPVPWLETAGSKHLSETVEPVSSVSTFPSPLTTPAPCPLVPSPLEIGGTDFRHGAQRTRCLIWIHCHNRLTAFQHHLNPRTMHEASSPFRSPNELGANSNQKRKRRVYREQRSHICTSHAPSPIWPNFLSLGN